jgi:precorrin-6A/cobalt-precorrin-6A reductase
MTDGVTNPARVLILGGTSESRELCERLAADARFDAVISLAGRTAAPKLVSIPVRSGGFGGIGGLAAYLRDQHIDVLLDATHPFAAQISANAIAAAEQTRVALVALERPEWQAQPSDRWQHHASAEAAVATLPLQPMRIFSGLGRLSLDALRLAPQHHYVIRIIDPLIAPLPVPHATIIEARGAFRTSDDIALFRAHGIEAVLAKNAGGTAAVSKIEAARALGLTVHMIARPYIPARTTAATVDAAIDLLAAHHGSSAKRGV